MNLHRIVTAAVWLSGMSLGLAARPAYVTGPATPPLPPREFRGVWVATVNNIDWPSKPGLPVAQQKAELLALLDRAVSLRLNAVIFQVRPACDVLYPSKLEPWSEYLTGQMGRPPQPDYDPLGFILAEAHLRGLELHAWFNPFRARHSSGRSPISRQHVSRVRPQLVRSYGEQLWLDPGDRATHDYSLAVILDAVRRYDLDGVHIDDYFYPYPEKESSGQVIEFPDNPSWQRYLQAGGKLGRSDWRRQNVDTFVQRLYQEIKAANPRVKVGVSPFGIWRPGFPPSVRGFDAYERLFADSRRWLASGWMDYCTPQLYWTIDAPGQSYPVLLDWWADQNVRHRHLWPGNDVYRASHTPGELSAQVQITRRAKEASGNVLWSLHALQQDKNGVAQELVRQAYAQSALVPASPWLDSRLPDKPAASAARSGGSWKVSWKAVGPEPAWAWVVQQKGRAGWITEILPGRHTSKTLSLTAPDVISVRAVGRTGNLGPPAVLQRKD